jgi:hypothetical protein
VMSLSAILRIFAHLFIKLTNELHQHGDIILTLGRADDNRKDIKSIVKIVAESARRHF